MLGSVDLMMLTHIHVMGGQELFRLLTKYGLGIYLDFP